MNTNKLSLRLFMASTLLALIFTAGCGMKNAIEGPAELSLAEQGNAIMTSLKAGDFQAFYEMMSSDAQRDLDEPLRIAYGVVDLDSIFKDVGASIATWNFDSARIFTKNGFIRGTLDGRMEYVDGASGKVRLEFEKQDGLWKLRNCSFRTVR